MIQKRRVSLLLALLIVAADVTAGLNILDVRPPALDIRPVDADVPEWLRDSAERTVEGGGPLLLFVDPVTAPHEPYPGYYLGSTASTGVGPERWRHEWPDWGQSTIAGPDAHPWTLERGFWQYGDGFGADASYLGGTVSELVTPAVDLRGIRASLEPGDEPAPRVRAVTECQGTTLSSTSGDCTVAPIVDAQANAAANQTDAPVALRVRHAYDFDFTSSIQGSGDELNDGGRLEVTWLDEVSGEWAPWEGLAPTFNALRVGDGEVHGRVVVPDGAAGMPIEAGLSTRGGISVTAGGIDEGQSATIEGLEDDFEDETGIPLNVDNGAIAAPHMYQGLITSSRNAENGPWQGFGADSGGLVESVFSLADFTGHLVRFRFVTSTAHQPADGHFGWVVDQVEVHGDGVPGVLILGLDAPGDGTLISSSAAVEPSVVAHNTGRQVLDVRTIFNVDGSKESEATARLGVGADARVRIAAKESLAAMETSQEALHRLSVRLHPLPSELEDIDGQTELAAADYHYAEGRRPGWEVTDVTVHRLTTNRQGEEIEQRTQALRRGDEARIRVTIQGVDSDDQWIDVANEMTALMQDSAGASRGQFLLEPIPEAEPDGRLRLPPTRDVAGALGEPQPGRTISWKWTAPVEAQVLRLNILDGAAVVHQGPDIYVDAVAPPALDVDYDDMWTWPTACHRLTEFNERRGVVRCEDQAALESPRVGIRSITRERGDAAVIGITHEGAAANARLLAAAATDFAQLPAEDDWQEIGSFDMSYVNEWTTTESSAIDLPPGDWEGWLRVEIDAEGPWGIDQLTVALSDGDNRFMVASPDFDVDAGPAKGTVAATSPTGLLPFSMPIECLAATADGSCQHVFLQHYPRQRADSFACLEGLLDLRASLAPALHFRHWVDTDLSEFATVEVLPDPGSEAPACGRGDDWRELVRFTGTTPAFETRRESVSLWDYAGQEVALRLRYRQDPSGDTTERRHHGWLVEDVRIAGQATADSDGTVWAAQPGFENVERPGDVQTVDRVEVEGTRWNHAPGEENRHAGSTGKAPPGAVYVTEPVMLQGLQAPALHIEHSSNIAWRRDMVADDPAWAPVMDLQYQFMDTRGEWPIQWISGAPNDRATLQALDRDPETQIPRLQGPDGNAVGVPFQITDSHLLDLSQVPGGTIQASYDHVSNSFDLSPVQDVGRPVRFRFAFWAGLDDSWWEIHSLRIASHRHLTDASIADVRLPSDDLPVLRNLTSAVPSDVEAVVSDEIARVLVDVVNTGEFAVDAVVTLRGNHPDGSPIPIAAVGGGLGSSLLSVPDLARDERRTVEFRADLRKSPPGTQSLRAAVALTGAIDTNPSNDAKDIRPTLLPYRDIEIDSASSGVSPFITAVDGSRQVRAGITNHGNVNEQELVVHAEVVKVTGIEAFESIDFELVEKAPFSLSRRGGSVNPPLTWSIEEALAPNQALEDKFEAGQKYAVKVTVEPTEKSVKQWWGEAEAIGTPLQATTDIDEALGKLWRVRTANACDCMLLPFFAEEVIYRSDFSVAGSSSALAKEFPATGDPFADGWATHTLAEGKAIAPDEFPDVPRWQLLDGSHPDLQGLGDATGDAFFLPPYDGRRTVAHRLVSPPLPSHVIQSGSMPILDMEWASDLDAEQAIIESRTKVGEDWSPWSPIDRVRGDRVAIVLAPDFPSVSPTAFSAAESAYPGSQTTPYHLAGHPAPPFYWPQDDAHTSGVINPFFELTDDDLELRAECEDGATENTCGTCTLGNGLCSWSPYSHAFTSEQSRGTDRRFGTGTVVHGDEASGVDLEELSLENTLAFETGDNPGTLYFLRGASTETAAGDVRLGGPLFGSVVGSGDADEHMQVTQAPQTRRICFIDRNGNQLPDLTGGTAESLFLSWSQSTVTESSIRLANPQHEEVGSLVSAGDDDLGQDCLDAGPNANSRSPLAYVDADGDEFLGNGEILYVDVNKDGILSVGDVQLTGRSEWVQALHDTLDALIDTVGADNVGLFSTSAGDGTGPTHLPVAPGPASVTYERRGHRLPILALDELERKLPTYGAILLMGDSTTTTFAAESSTLRRFSHGPEDAANRAADSTALLHHATLDGILAAAPEAGVRVIGSIGPAAATLARSGVVDGIAVLAVDTQPNIPSINERLRCTAAHTLGSPSTWEVPVDLETNQPRGPCLRSFQGASGRETGPNPNDPHNYQYISPYDAQKLALEDILAAANVQAIQSEGTRISLSSITGQQVVTAARSADADQWVASLRQAMGEVYSGHLPAGSGQWEDLPLSLGAPVGGVFRRADGLETFDGQLMQVRLTVRNATDAGGHGSIAVSDLALYGTPKTRDLGVRIISPEDGTSHHPGVSGLFTRAEVTNRGLTRSFPSTLMVSSTYVPGSATEGCELRDQDPIDRAIGPLAPGASVVIDVPLYGRVAPAPKATSDCPAAHEQTGQLEFKASLAPGLGDEDDADDEHAIRLHIRELIDLRLGSLVVRPTEQPVTGPHEVTVEVPLENHGTRSNLVATVTLEVHDASPVPCTSQLTTACQARTEPPSPLQVLTETQILQVPRGGTTHAPFQFDLDPGSYRIQAAAVTSHQENPNQPVPSDPAIAVSRVHLAGPGAGIDGGWGFEQANLGSIDDEFTVAGHPGGIDGPKASIREPVSHNGRFGPDAATQESRCQAAGGADCRLRHGWQEAFWCPPTDLVAAQADGCASAVPLLEWRRDEQPSFEAGVLPSQSQPPNQVLGMDDFGPDSLIWNPHTTRREGGPAPLSLAAYDDPHLNLLARIDASDHTAISVEMQLARRACVWNQQPPRYFCEWRWDWGKNQVLEDGPAIYNRSTEDWFPLRINGWTSSPPPDVFHSPYFQDGCGQGGCSGVTRQSPSNDFGARDGGTMLAPWLGATTTWGTPTPPHEASAAWQYLSIPLASQPGLQAYCVGASSHEDSATRPAKETPPHLPLDPDYDVCRYAPGDRHDDKPAARPVRFRVTVASSGADAGESTFQVRDMSLGDHSIGIQGASVLPVHGLEEREPRIVPIRVENRGAVEDAVRVAWAPMVGRSGLGGDMDIALDTSSAFTNAQDDVLVHLVPGEAQLVWIRIEAQIQSADVLPGSTLRLPFVVTAQSVRDAAAGADVMVDARLATRPWPDLEITRLILGEHEASPFAAAEGVRVEPTLLVRNKGHAPIGGPESPIHVLLRATELDEAGNEVPGTEETFADLVVEESIDPFRVTGRDTPITGLPAWTPPRQGVFAITAAINRPDLMDITADPLPEIDYLRNQATSVGVVGAVPFPDLRVQDAWLSPVDGGGDCRRNQRVERAVDGHAYCLTATIENAGNVGALAPEVAFWAQRTKHSSPPLDAIFPDDEFPAGRTIQVDSGTWIARQRPGGAPWQMEVEVSTRSTMLDFGQDARTLRFEVPVDAYAIRIDGLPDATQILPGQTTMIELTVANRGQVPATPQLSIIEVPGSVTASVAVQPPRLLPGERAPATIELTAPARATAESATIQIHGTTLEDRKVSAGAALRVDVGGPAAPKILALPATGPIGEATMDLVIDLDQAPDSPAWHVASAAGSVVDVDHTFSHAAAGRHVVSVPFTVAPATPPGVYDVTLRILQGEPPRQANLDIEGAFNVLPTESLQADVHTAAGHPVLVLDNTGNVDVMADLSHAVDFGEIASPRESVVVNAGQEREIRVEVHGGGSTRLIGSTSVEWRSLESGREPHILEVPWSVDRDLERLEIVNAKIPTRIRADAVNVATATVRNAASTPMEAEILLVVDGVVQSHAREPMEPQTEQTFHLPYHGGSDGQRHNVQVIARPSGSMATPDDDAFYASGDARIEETTARNGAGWSIPGLPVGMFLVAIAWALGRRRA